MVCCKQSRFCSCWSQRFASIRLVPWGKCCHQRDVRNSSSDLEPQVPKSEEGRLWVWGRRWSPTRCPKSRLYLPSKSSSHLSPWGISRITIVRMIFSSDFSNICDEDWWIILYLPILQLFPDLNKVILLDDDVVVQHDLSSLWELDLNEKVVGAVVDSWCGPDCCPGRKYKDYLNFTDPIISTSKDRERCGWLFGMNVFDLERWRKTNITAVYHHWLKLVSLSFLFFFHQWCWHAAANASSPMVLTMKILQQKLNYFV